MAKAKKSFGQHFLNNQRTIDRIAGLILSYANAHILEIGPGKGAITHSLINHVEHFKAVEADRDMVEYLRQHLGLTEDQLIPGDVLQLDFNRVFDSEEFVLCGNFPYNISSQIVIKTLENTPLIPSMIGMFQKEMAQRIIAKPGTREYGRLAVLTGLMYKAKIAFDISRGQFQPPPKVESAMLVLERLPEALTRSDWSLLQKLVRSAFQFKRKTLRNNLKSLPGLPQDILSDRFFDQRPEDVSPQEYLRLAKEFERLKNNTI
ncbi:MAG: ribosomal RNA small subunit methyltransferase A [Saprospiraceae bacterium]|nr:ribosomal RNA small subunit methyltransferase A [Saprospiraceae bacterium]MBK7795895.1 ribosomal RNA small subunit methyltransferase A [Saprospiraceae bacterium]MBK8154454.1 ribosomal RNA small subunit methyltransferase A [Saprospiraceae bacterium]MBL0261007.1 ribosomal RNA small subunit methyltransferase A [Saprospiraceae bacterium]